MRGNRKPAVAGIFYPAEPAELEVFIETMLDLAGETEVPGHIFGIVSPHAGYIYSGNTAAFVFNTIKDKDYRKVIILSPSHREYFFGACIYEGDSYETPLGRVYIDKELRDKLTSDSKIIFKGKNGHSNEHAVEVQIPFLQTVLDDFEIVPIVMGDQSAEIINETAAKIAMHADEHTLVIASSDLSHFYSKKEAFELDSVIERRIKLFDYNGLREDLEKRRCEACGGGPIVAMMKSASILNKNNSIVLHRSDSGDTSGDNSEVVGYLSAVVFGN